MKVPSLHAHPQSISEATVAISDYPETVRENYKRYLEERVFELLKNFRPWGINGETVKMLLMDTLVQEDMAKDLAAPDLQDVQKILANYWNMNEVDKQQQGEEFRALDVTMDEKKPNKTIQTAASGVIGIRTFVDVAADLSVLREVGKIRRNRKHTPKAKMRQAYKNSISSVGLLKSVEPVYSVVSERSERRKMTEKLLSVENQVSAERWEWLTDKQESLRHNLDVDYLLKSAIPEVENPVAATSDARKRAATGASHSSASSAISRRVDNTKSDAGEEEKVPKKRGKKSEDGKKTATQETEKEGRKKRKV